MLQLFAGVDRLERCDPIARPAPTPAGSPDAPVLLGSYRLLEPIASGGMGRIFRATQAGIGNRLVALKVLHRKLSEDEPFVARFQSAAASTGRVSHPNVVTVHECGRAEDGTLYVAMELVDGPSLAQHLAARGPLPVAEAVEITSQCCKALEAAHRLGIIHRDVRPGHAMLTRDVDGTPLVKVLDFGIAKVKDAGCRTVTGTILGTPTYMSPEQASGLPSAELDGRADTYALGILLYEMLAGQPPFRAKPPVACILQHLSEPPPPLRPLRPDVPAPVEAAMLRALEKDRDRRFLSPLAFAGALRAGLRVRRPG